MKIESLPPTEATYYSRAFRREIVPQLKDIKGLDRIGRSRFSPRNIAERITTKRMFRAVVVGFTLFRLSGIGDAALDYALSVFHSPRITHTGSFARSSDLR